MKKFIAALLLIVSASGHAQEAALRNGHWWQKLPGQEVKWGYLVGFFDGMGLGHRFSWWPLERDEKHSDCVPHVIDAWRSQVDQYLRNLDNQKLAAELDRFYTDPANKPIRVSNAVWIIANQLAGKPQAEVEEMIRDYRGR